MNNNKKYYLSEKMLKNSQSFLAFILLLLFYFSVPVGPQQKLLFSNVLSFTKVSPETFSCLGLYNNLKFYSDGVFTI